MKKRTRRWTSPDSLLKAIPESEANAASKANADRRENRAGDLDGKRHWDVWAGRASPCDDVP